MKLNPIYDVFSVYLHQQLSLHIQSFVRVVAESAIPVPHSDCLAKPEGFMSKSTHHAQLPSMIFNETIMQFSSHILICKVNSWK